MFLENRCNALLAEITETAKNQAAERQSQGLCPNVRLLLVSKYQNWQDLNQALDYFAHQTKILPNFGESYVQNATQRQQQLQDSRRGRQAPQLELIGPLQSNKAAKAAKLFVAIHSLASRKLLLALEKAQQQEQAPEQIPVYIQYNASGEAQKNGCRSYDQLRQLTEDLLEQSRWLYLRGLMCMGACGALSTDNRRAFAACRELALRLWREFGPVPGRLAAQVELSMGMSQDYADALAEGASVLRIGSLLFAS